MRTFWVLVRKELRELVTLQMLAPFVVVILLFVGVGNVVSAAGEEAGASNPITVVDNDASEYSKVITESLGEAGLDVDLIEGGDLDQTVAESADGATGLFLEIPAGLQASVERGKPQALRLRTVMRDFSLMGMADDAQVQAGVQIAGQAIAARLAVERAPDVPVAILQRPLYSESSVTVGEKTAETDALAVSGFISQQTVFIPIILFMVIMFASQLIATTIATEKENKTLETLLSYPVSRTALVTSKMFAAGLVSLVSAGAYMFGMQQYMSGLERGLGGEEALSGAQGVMAELGLTLGTSDYVILGLSLFAGILLALAISLILGAFADSVKAVGALITPLMVLLLVPYMLTTFIDLDAAGPVVRWGLLAVPFTHPFMAAKHLFFGNYDAVWLGIAYQLLWFVVFALIAARIFSSDRILTMKLDLRRKKSVPKAG